VGLKVYAYSSAMSNRAEKILQDIKTLEPDEQARVREALLQVNKDQGWDEQRSVLRSMQARHKGRGLLKRMLEERARERARG
jgi:hypothetical protein